MALTLTTTSRWGGVVASQPSSRTYLSSRIVVQENARLNFKPASNTSNVVDRDVALRPLDPAEISTIDAALVGQRFLAQTKLRSKAKHILRQGGPGAGVFPARRAPDAALINDRQRTKFTFDCPSDSFEIGCVWWR